MVDAIKLLGFPVAQARLVNRVAFAASMGWGAPLSKQHRPAEAPLRCKRSRKSFWRNSLNSSDFGSRALVYAPSSGVDLRTERVWLAILILQRFQPFGVGDVHPAELALPIVERRLRHPVLPGRRGRSPTC